MGNSTSSSRAQLEDTVDYGYLSPQGVYTTPKDYNQAIVSQLISARKLAPFYRPLEEYRSTWDDEQILAARKEFPDPDSPLEHPTTRLDTTHKTTQSKRSSITKEPPKPEATVYRGAVECPICFLFYPPNINYSRCCDQVICTECFVQIKRTEPTTTHLVSEPAACPYCVQDNFGVVYTPPAWRAGVGCETPSVWSDPTKGPSIDPPHPTHKRRQKSYSPESPEVVTSDQIRPDWEAKLAAVRAAVTRRANRRIIMRQVGDRLIPVGVTSGRVHAITQEDGQNDGPDNTGSRRSRRRHQHQNQEYNQVLGLAGQDLEDLMVMEAMRLSLLEHEDHMRREAQNRNSTTNGGTNTGAAVTSSTSFLTVPGTSTLSNSDSTTPSSSVPASSTTSPSSSLSSGESPSCPPSNSATVSPTSHPSGPDNPIAALQGMSDTTTSWRRRTSSPPPFTTLSAIMGAAATATTVLGSHASTETSQDLIRSAPIIAVDGSTIGTNGEGDVPTSPGPHLASQDLAASPPLPPSDQTKDRTGPNPTALPSTHAPDPLTAPTTIIPDSIVDQDG